MRSFTCPNCNAGISVEDDSREFAFCQYCGTKIMLDDHRETHRYVDEAKVRQAETDRMIRLRELEMQEEEQKRKNRIRSVLLKIWLGISAFTILLDLLVWIIYGGEYAALFFFYIVLLAVAGGAFLIFVVLPGRDAEQALLRNGNGIRFPRLDQSLEEMNFETLEQILKTAGFTNVNTINMHDLRLGLLTRPGRIESVTVNGKPISGLRKVYPADSQIVIRYHGR
jgi:transcription elongation factor Elf1